MKIFAISMCAYSERRAFQLEQAKKYNLNVEFIDAVDGADLSAEFCQQAVDQWTKPLSVGVFGCFLSHRCAWERVANERKPALIIEDDAIFSKKIAYVLDFIDQRDDAWNCIYDLEFVNKKSILASTPFWQNDAHDLRATRIFKATYGAGGYILSPQAAQKLTLEETKFKLLDAMLWTRPWLKMYQIEPAPIIQQHIIESARCFDAQQLATRTDRFKPSSNIAARARRMKFNLQAIERFLRRPYLGQRRYVQIQKDSFES